MMLSRTLRKSIGRLLVGAVLFAQLAVASYACPGLNATGLTAKGGAATALNAVASGAASAKPAGIDCDQMDRDTPNLCADHCRPGQQAADAAAAPVFGAGVPTFLYSLPIEPQHSLGSGRSFPAPGARLDAAPEPPHAILHCVLRT